MTEVLLHGDVFLDVVFSGLAEGPVPGRETYVSRLAWAPGGIANLAFALARLGTTTTLAAALSSDLPGRWCRAALAAEGVDLRRAAEVEQPSNVTVSLSGGGDRAMLTREFGAQVPVGELSGVRAVVTDLGGGRSGQAWWQQAAAAGARVYADVGWDDTGRWDPAVLEPLAACRAFLPNEAEATAYTRTASAASAAAALSERVPLAVVTRGADGAVAARRGAGGRLELVEAAAPAVPGPVVDATGAGDCFTAAFVFGDLAGWPLAQTLDFAALAGALAVRQVSGSFGAPGWYDFAAWWRAARAASGALAARYAFLDAVIPPGPHEPPRRADEAMR